MLFEGARIYLEPKLFFSIILCNATFLIIKILFVFNMNILWHVYPLLGNERETSYHTTAVGR
jgi:hypothetical protein